MITTTPIAVDTATELAQREQFLERTRSARIAGAQALLQQCAKPTVRRQVNVLMPYIRLDGSRGFYKCPRTRQLLIRI